MQARTSLWSRFAGWANAARRPQDMSLEWTCCGTPGRDPTEAYLGRVDAYKFAIHSCVHCGALWLQVQSVATTVARSEPLSGADAEAFLAAAPGIERRKMMRAWLQRHLQPTGSRAS
jgi:hypothetical protein